LILANIIILSFVNVQISSYRTRREIKVLLHASIFGAWCCFWDQASKIEYSPIWDIFCLAEIIYDLVNKPFLCRKCPKPIKIEFLPPGEPTKRINLMMTLVKAQRRWLIFLLTPCLEPLMFELRDRRLSHSATNARRRSYLDLVV